MSHVLAAAEELVVVVVGRCAVAEPPHGGPTRRVHQTTVAGHLHHLTTGRGV